MKVMVFDVGGTEIKYSVMDEQMNRFDAGSVPTPQDTLAHFLDTIYALYAPHKDEVDGIAMALPGFVDANTGYVSNGGALLYNTGTQVGQLVRERCGCRVTLENDGKAAAIAELRAGALQGCCNAAVFIIGTGVGGGILTGGRLLEGARGLGGELGHYRTHALDGVPCTCGATGCWERYAATTALVRAAQEKDPAWKDGRAIFAAAKAGNETVLALLDAWTDEIAQGLAGMVHIFNPQLILIGGGVSAQQKLLIEPIAAKVKASVMPAFAEGLEVRAAQLHNDAGMVGAVYYFRQTMEKE